MKTKPAAGEWVVSVVRRKKPLFLISISAVAVSSAAIPVLPTVLHHVTNPDLMWIKTAKQRCASRTTPGGVIKLSHPDAAGCELIEIGRIDLAAVTADI